MTIMIDEGPLVQGALWPESTPDTRIVWRRFVISAAHRLPGHPKCKNLHGHNYTIEIGVRGPVYSGMIMDFGKLKTIFHDYVECYYDHNNLNSLPGMTMPTVENMIVDVAHRMIKGLKDSVAVATLAALKIYETPDCWCTWTASRPSRKEST